MGGLGVAVEIGHPHRILGDIDVVVDKSDFDLAISTLLSVDGAKAKSRTSVRFHPQMDRILLHRPALEKEYIPAPKIDVFCINSGMLFTPDGFSRDISSRPAYGEKSMLLGEEMNRVGKKFLAGTIGSGDVWKNRFDRHVLGIDR